MASADDNGRVLAAGLMSGTSLDGIDAALMRTDGRGYVEPLAAVFHPYDEKFRHAVRQLIAAPTAARALPAVEHELTQRHTAAIDELLIQAGVAADDVRIIGFHGHTIAHAPAPGRPNQGMTNQIGDGERLAAATGVDVVNDFRSADVAAGGEGAPLAPIYHAALAPTCDVPLPLCVLNIGGVGNVTWVSSDGNDGQQLIAFDTGPGNALIDDFVAARTGQTMDVDGALAARGSADAAIVERILQDAYYRRPPPKSLDRDHFRRALDLVVNLSDADGAATLTAITVRSITAAAELLPGQANSWAVTGGGRKNAHLMKLLRASLGGSVVAVEELGWQGDMIEAQAFAYMAVRRLRDLPISFPGTTGVPLPMTGGIVHVAP